ncbi:GTP-binding protein HflX [Desulfonema ishimotonii]|uniref:GTPase HflX n=1 Tax=Desulfonema ishimotonii TaxID=45657 RepID=A0A401FPY3_9BACT|nr:GTPase HflX [Desulfonema ishimotonii]GBC59074.1 GTP-binding protein HflX [Desulfonema ishimotonii]
MKKLYGNTTGLKADQTRRLENLYRRRIPNEFAISPDLARDLAHISHEIRRQVGILVNRSGKITHVIAGDTQKIVIPDTPEYRTVPGRLKGLRCLHTHLKDEPLTGDDLTDLSLLRLDLMGAITLTPDGGFHQLHIGHILPKGTPEAPWQLLPPLSSGQLDMGCHALIRALESELAQIRALYAGAGDQERAILVSVTTGPRHMARDSLDELRDLADSGGIHVVDTVLQQRKKADPRLVMGRGKLQELALMALQRGVTLIIFDQELNPSQIRSLTDQTDLKILDRTQLILDIFAQRARTREGKLQVEMAQLKYLLPRLVIKNTAMSRLTGGIGGRGPGETKLEINRRRARERINRLEKDLSQVIRHRQRQKSRRSRKGLPIISIVGYTNAGKSTLLNTLTQSKVMAEDRLFATLDPTSRRLRFPRETEVIITDTVGFIRDLPRDLVVAFRATLEELNSADLLLHVIDISNPRFEEQIESVSRILSDLDLEQVRVIRVLNKQDRLDPEQVAILARKLDGIPISANRRATLIPLIEKMEAEIENRPPTA